MREYGSGHYKGDVEPIDLYHSLGLLKGYIFTDIIKRCVRNHQRGYIDWTDIQKIVDDCEILREFYEKGEDGQPVRSEERVEVVGICKARLEEWLSGDGVNTTDAAGVACGDESG